MLNLTPRYVTMFPYLCDDGVKDPPYELATEIFQLMTFKSVTEARDKGECWTRAQKIAEIVEGLGHHKVVIDSQPFFTKSLVTALNSRGISCYYALMGLEDYDVKTGEAVAPEDFTLDCGTRLKFLGFVEVDLKYPSSPSQP